MQWLKYVFLLASWLVIGGSTVAQVQVDPESPPPRVSNPVTLTASDLEAFLDRTVPQQLEALHIPGATLAVVKDGSVLLAKGYGFADLEQKKPVVASNTLFRTGSVAKLFTWTAIMQLVEQGKLDLNADINTYLDGFQIPAKYPQPITLKHLLTHTAGFEDKIIGTIKQRPEDLEPLDSFVTKRIPARIYPPGTVTAYSNYGTTLAGYIVERTSGMPYERYVQKHIFEPLRMMRTDFEQPPKAFTTDVANGYTYSNGEFQRGAFEVMQFVPAGSLSATASDMAHFLMAQLQGGKFEGKQILQPSTVQEMQHQQFSNDPGVSGMAYGFYLAKIQGHRVLLHHGETSFFRTLFALLPEQNFGLYVAYNSSGGSVATDTLLNALLERYFPGATTPSTLTGSIGDPKRFAGQYLSTRSSHSTLEKVTQLFVPFYQPIRVRANVQGLLEIEMPTQKSLDPPRNKPSSWQPVGTNAFERSDGKDTLVFADRVINDHSSTMLFFDSKAPRGYVRLSWFDSLMFQPLVPILCIVGFVLALIFLWVSNRTVNASVDDVPRGAYWLTVTSSALALVMMIGLGVYLLLGFSSLLSGQISPVLIGLLTIGLLLIPLTLASAVVALAQHFTGVGPVRWGTTLSASAGAVLLVWLNYWNLLGFRF